MVVDEEVLPDGIVVVLDVVLDGVPDEEEEGVVVVELVVEPELSVLGVVVVDEVEDGGADGTTTVVDELGGVEVVEDGGVWFWHAPSVNNALAATAEYVSRVIGRAPSYKVSGVRPYGLAGLVPRSRRAQAVAGHSGFTDVCTSIGD